MEEENDERMIKKDANVSLIWAQKLLSGFSIS